MIKTKNYAIKKAYNNFVYAYNKYGFRTIENCYVKPSYFKEKAQNYCFDTALKYNVEHYTIIGYNCMTFSVGFIGTINNKKAFFLDYQRL